MSGRQAEKFKENGDLATRSEESGQDRESYSDDQDRESYTDTLESLEGAETEEEEEAQEASGITPPIVGRDNYENYLPLVEREIVIVSRGKLAGDKIIVGRKKTVEIRVIIPYESDKIQQVNDLLGSYVEVEFKHVVYATPLSPMEKDAMNQLQFDFQEEVGA
mgnify:CR=1 FL=1